MSKRRNESAPDPYDVTTCVQEALHGPQEGPAAASGPWTPPPSSEPRRRRSRDRTYGRDTLPGLTDYFIAACPPISWAGTLEIGNRQAVLGIFSELRREAHLSPDDCRALVDLYVSRLGDRRPSKAYAWDFKWQRYQLLGLLRDKGLACSSANHSSWDAAYTADPSEADAFAKSWGSL